MFAKADVLRTFLIAFVFLIVFGALGFLIYFLFEKFLSADGSSSMTDFSSLSTDNSKKGQAVDIVIQDDDLPADSNTNQFNVGSRHFLLNAEDKKSSASTNVFPETRHPEPKPKPESSDNSFAKPENINAVEKSEKEEGLGSTDGTGSKGESSVEKDFVPIRNLETLYNVSGKESISKNEQQSESESDAETSSSSSEKKAYTADDEQLDILPDLEDYSVTMNNSGSSAGNQDLNGDSDFASPGEYKSRKDNEPEVKDAELMAKAISTILASEG